MTVLVVIRCCLCLVQLFSCKSVESIEVTQTNVDYETYLRHGAIHCSGELVENEERYVRMADFRGSLQWVESSKVLRITPFNFKSRQAAPRDTPRSLKIIVGQPACGGPGLLETASSVLPSYDLHMVEILRGINDIVLRSIAAASNVFHGLTTDVHYRPFFPILLMMLHRQTGESHYLHCLAHTSAYFAHLPE
eukprot:TRINITY_DN51361_c0_g1_i1.p1 TRINITY_DN51361_c0_g1~~TRINITY_DN51361_c0_g1_i1.p1  ORF type:complete len:207 (+),score=9.01 TRINITY_DN51361_c0_g1_i1:45-623(+)